MAKGERLNMRQEAFCIALAVEGLSQRQAYIKAYGDKSSAVDIDSRACILTKNTKVSLRLSELRDRLAETAIWSKADMITDLKAICAECKTAPKLVFEKGDLYSESIDSKARSVAVNAIKTAGEMLGYKSPDKVENSGEIKIIMSEELRRYGE